MIIHKLIGRVNLIWHAFSDYDCGEFHVTPVITLAWPLQKDKDQFTTITQSKVLAIEWGFWAAYVGYAVTSVPRA